MYLLIENLSLKIQVFIHVDYRTLIITLIASLPAYWPQLLAGTPLNNCDSALTSIKLINIDTLLVYQ